MPITVILLICTNRCFRPPMVKSRGVSSGFGQSNAQCFECTENSGGQWKMKQLKAKAGPELERLLPQPTTNWSRSSADGLVQVLMKTCVMTHDSRT